MNEIYYIKGDYILDGSSKFKVGDLVTTLLQEYGIIVGFGRHPDYENDNTGA